MSRRLKILLSSLSPTDRAYYPLLLARPADSPMPLAGLFYRRFSFFLTFAPLTRQRVDGS